MKAVTRAQKPRSFRNPRCAEWAARYGPVMELLCPAGSKESFYAALNAGADAIYMGITRFNAREMAENFDVETYINCMKAAHRVSVKVYLTLNTLLTDEEIEEAVHVVNTLQQYGLDAVIVQDIGLAVLLHNIFPDLVLHASTQMSVYSLEQVQFLKTLGFRRVVLARELSVQEIKNICQNTDVEIEVFVHGALCVSYSGQCLMSAMIGTRSANRGNCAQPCRMRYTLTEGENQKEVVSQKYLLSNKDIFGLEHLKRLRDIGVVSLKIEGRNKPAAYTAGVTQVYRKHLDKLRTSQKLAHEYEQEKENDKRKLKQLFNRSGISTGYLDGIRYNERITPESPKNTGIYLGRVLDQQKLFVKIKLEEEISMHDGFEIFPAKEECSNDGVVYGTENPYSSIVTCIKNEPGRIVNESVKTGNTVWLGDVKTKIPKGSDVYKTSDSKQNRELAGFFKCTSLRKTKIPLFVHVKKNEKLSAVYSYNNQKYQVSIDYIVPSAKTRAITKVDIEHAFSKAEEYAYAFSFADLEIEDGVFVPVSVCNSLRRAVIDSLEEKINQKQYLPVSKHFIDDQRAEILCLGNAGKMSITCNTFHVFSYRATADYISIYIQKYGVKPDRIYIEIEDMIQYQENIFRKYKGRTDIFIAIPNIVGENIHRYITNHLEQLIKKGASGILLGSFRYMNSCTFLKHAYHITLVADYALNVTNCYSAAFLVSLGFDIITPSVELPEDKMKAIAKYVQTEVSKDYVTVMTSRYCILASYTQNKAKTDICEKYCMKKRYFLRDRYGGKYTIHCDCIDCIMRILKRTHRYDNITGHNVSIRRNIID